MNVAPLRLLPNLEASLSAIPDIRAASVVTNGAGDPVEVHVLARSGKAAKQVVRDVQSVALVEHGVDLDHRIVSVVQFDDEDVAEITPASAAPRPVVSAVGVQTSGETVQAEICIRAGAAEYLGSASGLAITGRPRVVASATLKATESLLGLSAELQYVDVVLAGRFKVALCVVAVVGLAGPHVVSGSALVRHDESDAVARAILDALNRRLSG
ncbi:MAG TPA: hypothetical protein VGO94_01795 [Mycobacteriales bacterium]|jgi:hypothetical protein|nr:hypothetical protein [Mycobacteriales bacterium]